MSIESHGRRLAALERDKGGVGGVTGVDIAARLNEGLRRAIERHRLGIPEPKPTAADLLAKVEEMRAWPPSQVRDRLVRAYEREAQHAQFENNQI